MSSVESKEVVHIVSQKDNPVCWYLGMTIAQIAHMCGYLLPDMHVPPPYMILTSPWTSGR